MRIAFFSLEKEERERERFPLLPDLAPPPFSNDHAALDGLRGAPGSGLSEGASAAAGGSGALGQTRTRRAAQAVQGCVVLGKWRRCEIRQ
jgi:hypothetical protein